MDGFTFGAARRADEPEIRALVGATPMPGAVAVRFEREPDYFLGCDVMGRTCQVLMARHQPDGELAGVLCRSEQAAYVNGVEQTVGWFGQLRIAEPFRGRRLLQQGWPVFDRPDLLYLAVVAHDNPAALRTLTRRAPHDPSIRHLGEILTLGLPVRRGHREPPSRRGRTVRLSPATPGCVDDLIGFLEQEGPRRQLTPVRRACDLVEGDRFRGLALDDITVAREGSTIVGCLGCWDQRGFKQDVVAGYSRPLAVARPALDALALLAGAAPLPAPGQAMQAGFAALVAVARDDSRVFSALLDECLAVAARRGLDWLMLGLAAHDPLLPVARRRLHITYRAHLFALTWRRPPHRVDERCPYVEIATL